MMTTFTDQAFAANGQGRLKDRVAAVTGATSGIGAATAERLAAEGARVALLGRREERLRALAESIAPHSGTVIAIGVDVSDGPEMTRAAERITAGVGTVDLVVNSAGVMLPGAITSQPVSEWRTMIDTNLVGSLNATRSLLPGLIEAADQGRAADLVNISSIGGKRVFPRYAVYGATKAALTQLSAMLRAELSPRGVRVTDIQPGLTESELAGNVTDPDSRAGLEDMFHSMQALSASDIADLIVYVASRPPHVSIPTLDIVPTAQV